MSELPKHIQLLDASRNALKPLFRIFLRSGISYKDFTEVAKSLFVEISTDEYGLRGRKTNISRVAIMTGLTRKEVKKIRDEGWEKMRENKISNKLSPHPLFYISGIRIRIIWMRQGSPSRWRMTAAIRAF